MTALTALLVLLAGSLGFLAAAILGAHKLGSAEHEVTRLRRLLELDRYARPRVIDLRDAAPALVEPTP